MNVYLRLEALLGRPDLTGRPALDHARCVELVELVRSAAPGVRLRREDWERRARGVTLCLGSDFSVILGLDFPSGEPGRLDGGWVRCQDAAGASQWLLTRREASRIWLLLIAYERCLAPSPERRGPAERAPGQIASPRGGDDRRTWTREHR